MTLTDIKELSFAIKLLKKEKILEMTDFYIKA